jgi:2-dehydropantoate 2-reductase
MFSRTPVTAVLHPDIRVALWEKFVALAATGGVMAMTRLPMGRALGIPLPEDCVDQHWTLVSGLDPSVRGSMLQDLLGGRRLELEALNGTVVRLGRRAGISTPLNFAVYAALKPYADGAPSE